MMWWKRCPGVSRNNKKKEGLKEASFIFVNDPQAQPGLQVIRVQFEALDIGLLCVLKLTGLVEGSP